MNSAYQKDPLKKEMVSLAVSTLKYSQFFRGICQKAKFPANLRQIPMIQQVLSKKNKC